MFIFLLLWTACSHSLLICLLMCMNSFQQVYYPLASWVCWQPQRGLTPNHRPLSQLLSGCYESGQSQPTKTRHIHAKQSPKSSSQGHVLLPFLWLLLLLCSILLHQFFVVSRNFRILILLLSSGISSWTGGLILFSCQISPPCCLVSTEH